MAFRFTKEEAMKDLPFIKDEALSKGVGLALWLYLDKNFSLKNSVNIAAKKHSVTPKIAIERLLRQVIPEEVIWARMSETKPKKTKASTTDSVFRGQNMKKMEKDGKRHLADITRR